MNKLSFAARKLTIVADSFTRKVQEPIQRRLQVEKTNQWGVFGPGFYLTGSKFVS